MIKYLTINNLEESIFNSESRFKLKKEHENEISKDLKNSNILIFERSSINKHFLKLKIEINKLVFFIKTKILIDLNREINLNYNFKIKRVYLSRLK